MKRIDYVGAVLTRQQRTLIVQAIVRLAHTLPTREDHYGSHSGDDLAECKGCQALAAQVSGQYGDEDDDA
jgi:hypothetical protein